MAQRFQPAGRISPTGTIAQQVGVAPITVQQPAPTAPPEDTQAYEDYQKKLKEYQHKVNLIKSAYNVLNEKVSESGSLIKGSKIVQVERAFREAGLSASEGKKLYIKAIKSGGAYQYSKQATEKIGAWSEKYQMTPTRETIAAITWRPGEGIPKPPEPIPFTTPPKQLTPQEKFFTPQPKTREEFISSIISSIPKQKQSDIITQPKDAIIPYKELTKKEKEETEFLEAMYEPSKTGEFVSRQVGRISSWGQDIWKDVTGKKQSKEELAFGVFPTITKMPKKETFTYEPTPIEKLPKDVGYFKEYTIGESLASEKLKIKLEGKREEILKEISIDGITEAEAKSANERLSKYWNQELAKERKEYKIREEKRQEQFYPKSTIAKFLPEWKLEPVKEAREIWGGLKPFSTWERTMMTKGTVATLSFAHGMYTGVREKPLKTAITAGAFIALPAGLKFVGVGAKTLGITKIAGYFPKSTMYLGKGIKYGLPALYGTSVAGRILLTPDFYDKFKLAGEITSTEILPMTFGLKVGAYGVRRYEAGAELRKWTKELPPVEKEIFLGKLREAKAYGKIQPKVKELSLKRLKLLEVSPQAQKEILGYFKGKKDIIVGGSLAQETQMIKGIKLKRPGDVDVYIKSFGLKGEEVLGQLHAQEIAKILKKSKFKDVIASEGKVKIGGEKLIEFHPYKSYLRYNIEQVLPWYKTAGSGITATPSGIKVLKLPVQWQRKLIGGYLEPYITGKFRLKDVPAAESIRESMMRTAQAKTISKPFEMKSYLGKDIVGMTRLDVSKKVVTFFSPISKLPISIQKVVGPILKPVAKSFLRPQRIFIKKGLSPFGTSLTKSHELIHAMHPTWSEAKVLKAGGFGFGKSSKELLEWKGLTIQKHLKTQLPFNIRGGGILDYYYKPTTIVSPIYYPYKPTKISKVSFKEFTYFKTKPFKEVLPVIKYKSIIPKQIKPIVSYKPTIQKGIKSMIPYKPIVPYHSKIPPTPYVPYKPKERIKPKKEEKIYPLKLPSMAQPIVKKQQSYYPEAKEKGGKKWLRLAKQPMSMSNALSRASKAVDKTTGASFRIVKTGKKIVPLGKDPYFDMTKHKYREGLIRGKQLVRTPNRFVEHRKYRIDTSGEVQGLSLAKYAKQMGWLGIPKAKTKKKRRKK